ncbi:OmpA family protein [Actinocorallia sp. B10E7]|uniref:OmpA family protein n=1 Tax=Actinocorallia sp. B10E7 TaxID=3153558 RepID=UPI00325E1F99
MFPRLTRRGSWRACTAVLLLLTAACTDGTSPSPSPSPEKTASGLPAPPAGPDTRPALATVDVDTNDRSRLELVGLNRYGPEHVLVQIRITNTHDDHLNPMHQINDHVSDRPDFQHATGIALVDAEARQVLAPLRTPGGCVCSTDEDDYKSYLDPGEHKTFFAVVPAPSGGARTTTVLHQMGAPFLNVPISDEPPTAPPGQAVPPPVGEKVVYPIEAHSEDPDTEVRDNGREVEVSISSDVLFAVDSSALAPAAGRLLEKTAARIGGGTVRVEGHADSTGTDEINDPLSQRRAEAVAERLRALVPGAVFEPKGFGSRRPLYSNDEEEGRRRNRRVTITFTRTEATQTPAPATSSTSSQADGFTVAPDALRPIGGGLGVLTYTVTNTNPEETWRHEMSHDEGWQRIRFNAAINVELADGDHRIRPARYTVRDSSSRANLCLCSSTSGVWIGANNFDPKETKHFWALLQLPSAPTTTAEIGDLPAVPVSVTQ